jgi:hypothetical protein
MITGDTQLRLFSRSFPIVDVRSIPQHSWSIASHLDGVMVRVGYMYVITQQYKLYYITQAVNFPNYIPQILNAIHLH